MLSNDQIPKYLNRLKNELLKTKISNIRLADEWFKIIPEEPGCYVAFENNKVVYVGETINLKRRMRNLNNSTNHVLRRNIARINFSGMTGYKDASSRKKFPDHIEKRLNKYIEKNIRVSMISIKLGRKELEELIISEFDCIYNKKGKKK